MRRTWPRVVGRLRPYRARVALGIGLVTASSLAELAKPWPVKIVVDQVLAGRPLPLLGYPERLAPSTLLAWAALGLVALFVVLGFLSLATNRLTIDVGHRMVQDLRRDLFAHMERLSLGFHRRRFTGDLVHRLVADTLALQTIATNAVFPTLSAILFLVGMVVVMARLHVGLTALALGVVPCIAISVRLLGRRIESVATEARKRESELYATTEARLSLVPLPQAFGAEEAEVRQFSDASRASLRRHLDLYTIQTAYGAVVGVLGAIGTAGVLWLGARLVGEGRLTIGDLLVFTSYMASFYAPIAALSHGFGLIQEARAGLARVFEVLDEVPEVAPGPLPLDPGSVRGHVSVEGVEFAYEPDRPVLRGLSLEVRAGEKLVLTGPSGSGKTTLALLLLRFLDPQRGYVRLDGQDLRRLDLVSLRRAFGVVLQPPLFVPGTVRENVAYGRPEASDEEIEEVLRAAELWSLVEGLPEGIDTPLLVAANRLSQGERQRLSLARALLVPSAVLILDEPGAALDAATEARLFRALEQARRGRTCVVISHGAAAQAWADRIAILREGRIVAIGPPDELRGRSDLDPNPRPVARPESDA